MAKYVKGGELNNGINLSENVFQIPISYIPKVKPQINPNLTALFSNATLDIAGVCFLKIGSEV